MKRELSDQMPFFYILGGFFSGLIPSQAQDQTREKTGYSGFRFRYIRRSKAAYERLRRPYYPCHGKTRNL